MQTRSWFSTANGILDMLEPLASGVGKLENLLKVVVGFGLAKRGRQMTALGLPFSVSVEPTTSCNLRCPECPSGLRSFTRKTGMLDSEFYERVLAQMHNHLVYLNLYFQGEPYLHPEFLRLVQQARRRNIYVSTSTNAHYLNEKNAEATVRSGLSRLIISLDGMTQATYEQYRIGGKVSKVFEGVANLVAAKERLGSSTPLIVLQYLVVGPNEHEIDEAKAYAKRAGVDKIVFKTAQIYDYEAGSALMPKDDKYSRYRQGPDGKYAIKNAWLNHCWKMWHSCVITWDGYVVPCCFDKDAVHKMGDLNTTPLTTIWQNELYADFRSKLLAGRKEIEICQNCTEGTEVFAD